jgi:hypothetical protein
MAFFILAREGPPLAGLEASLGAAAATSVAGTALVVLVWRLIARRRSRRGGSHPGTKRAAGATTLYSKLERKPS